MKRGEGGHEEGEVGAWRRKENDMRQGGLEQGFGFYALLAMGFFPTYRALQATRCTALVFPTR